MLRGITYCECCLPHPTSTKNKDLAHSPGGQLWHHQCTRLPSNRKWEDSEFSPQTTNKLVLYNHSRLITVLIAKDCGITHLSIISLYRTKICAMVVAVCCC